MSFPRYPAYKPSGVEWLGDVPKHWRIDRIKRSTVSCQNGIWGDEPQQDENDIPCVRVADFDRQRLCVELREPTVRSVTEKERAGRVLNQGDLLLEKSGGGETQPVGCVVLYVDARPAVCSNFVARVQIAEDMSSSFWRYVHAATYAVRLNTRSIKQTSGIQNLDASQYFDERAGFPPMDEQTAIAAFLDRETGKIDALVAEQRRLMELLKEKRQAVISHAVTRGLNPKAKLKPSGIEWLGEVPEHWRVVPLKHVCKIESGHTPQKSNEAYWVQDDCCIPWISLNDTKTLAACDFIDDTEVKISELGMQNSSAHLIEAGAVVMNRDGARVGLSAITTKPMCVSQHIIAWVCRASVFNYYLLHVLYAMNNEIYRLAGGATIPTIGMPDIKEMTMPLPPLSEQKEIVAHLLDQRQKLDTLTAEAQRAIDLLQERRTALISAAVTGQIDVRGLAPITLPAPRLHPHPPLHGRVPGAEAMQAFWRGADPADLPENPAVVVVMDWLSRMADVRGFEPALARLGLTHDQVMDEVFQPAENGDFRPLEQAHPLVLMQCLWRIGVQIERGGYHDNSGLVLSDDFGAMNVFWATLRRKLLAKDCQPSLVFETVGR